MSLGAFAGGLTKGFMAGEDIKDTRERRKQEARRVAIAEEDLGLRKEADERAKAGERRAAEDHDYKLQQRKREKGYEDYLQGEFAALKEKYPEGFNPIAVPEHGAALERVNANALVYRMGNGLAKPEEIKQFREAQTLLKNESSKKAVAAYLTTGDVNALAPVAQTVGIDVSQLKPVKLKDGSMGLQLPNGETMPNHYFAALLMGGDVSALRQRDQKHESDIKRSDAQIRASDASAANSRAHAATAGASALGETEKRLQAIKRYAKEKGITEEEAAKKLQELGTMSPPRTDKDAAGDRMFASIEKAVREDLKWRRKTPEEQDAEIDRRFQRFVDSRGQRGTARTPNGDRPAASAEKPPQAFIDQMKKQPAGAKVRARNGTVWVHDGNGNVNQVQ